MECEIKQRKGHNETIPKPPSPKPLEKLKEFPPKEFILRNSVLTDLLEIPHLRAVYNICLAFFILTYLHISILYFLDSEKFKKNISVVIWLFSKFHIVVAVWSAMNVSIIFMLYPTFRFWATTRSEIKITQQKYYDLLFCALYIIYQLGLLFFPAKVVVMYNLPPVSAIIVLTEQLRLMMKAHAFVRENEDRVLRYKPHRLDEDKEDSKPCPEVGKLIYFLFAPTFLYRDNYPRTPFIRWSYVAWNFLQVIACILAAYIPVFHFYLVVFNKIGMEPIPLVNFIEIFAMSHLNNGLIAFVLFYGFSHCWLNAFSEMLQFGDRKFYDDWWNCTSFAKLYRSITVIVHEWLHSYIYRDMQTVWNQSKVGATLAVFITSAIFHEYFVTLLLGFFLPLLFISTAISAVILLFITRGLTSKYWNVIFWLSFLLTCEIQPILYIIEGFARINCPATLDSWLDYVVPRSFSCNIISLPS